MEHKKIFDLRSGTLVCQIHGSINFAYNLLFGQSRDNWKGPSKEQNIEKVLHHAFIYTVP